MKQGQTAKLNDPRTINGWALFDWANSAYALTIAVAIFPAYYEETTEEVIEFGGHAIYNTTLFALVLSASYLLIAMMSPLLSGIADYSGRKKVFLRFFTAMGSLACMSLFFFRTKEELLTGTLGFMLATIGFAGSLVFYNAYLPAIATEDRYNRVSARGFAFGYVGSVILLIVNLAVIMKPGWFGMGADAGTLPVRLSFLTVGLWWLGFAQLSLSRLPADSARPFSGELLMRGFGELRKVWGTVRQSLHIRRFLLAFFCYSAGVQTVLSLASLFAKVEMRMETAELILVILLLQLVGLAGAYFFARLSDAIGNKAGLLSMLAMWALICLAGFFVEEKWQFYALASGVGLMMGGVQSQSRATYAKLIPKQTADTTSYFSFYDVLEKSATALGAFSFAFTGQLFGTMRHSVLGLAAFFVLGLIFLSGVKIKESSQN